MTASEVTREMSVYVTEAFYTYEAMRDARDEALCRVDELTDERDQARRIAASLEAEVAKVRQLHAEAEELGVSCCSACLVAWPCATAEAVYLP